MLLYALRRAGIPQLAAWKRDCAWLRAIVQRALVLHVVLPDLVEADTLTTECVTLEQLRVLHTFFIEAEPRPVAPLKRVVTIREPEPQPEPASAGDDAAADPPAPLLLMPSSPRMASLGGSRTMSVRMPSLAVAHVPDHPLPPGGARGDPVARARIWLRRLRTGAAKLARASTRVARTRLSGMLWSSERDLLLGALLAWAKLDEGSLVSEPQDNHLRWRTQHEWDALRDDRARLGEHDVREMRAFQRLSFLFSSYACRAWWWESIDLLQKLFLTSVLTFIAPRTSVQIIAACLFAFASACVSACRTLPAVNACMSMSDTHFCPAPACAVLLAVLQIKPYRSASGNQLAALSQINVRACATALRRHTHAHELTHARRRITPSLPQIFLFLFCGLLLNTDPGGIAGERILFSVLIGALTTSIVGFSMLIFLRELANQLLRALYGYDDDEGEDEADEEWDGEEYNGEGGYEGALVVHHLEGVRESEEGNGVDDDEHEAPSALAIAAGEHGSETSSRAEELVAVASAAEAAEAAPAPASRERQGEPGDSGWR
jgi:hypothetical protein